jgi:DNA polymerase-3 subunit alpha
MTSNSENFVHLHVHTDYSMLDGAAKIDELLDKAVDFQMPAIAITDHGNNFGAYEFWQKATKKGIKPIIGIEAYLAPGSRLDKSRTYWADGGEDDLSKGSYSHLTMLSTDNDSMMNLFKLSSHAWLEGYYFQPRMDRELLAKYAKGIIATSGCAGGEVQTRLRLGQYKEALETAAEFRDIFGKENYFIEIMDHGASVERRSFDDLIRLSKDLGIPLLATNDLHYTEPGHVEAQEALLCLQTGTQMNDEKRFKFDGEGYYLKSARQMRELFADFPEACDNTLLVAERSDIRFEERNLMPRFEVPAGHTEASWFEQEVLAGMKARFGNTIAPEYQERIAYEIEVIKNMNFPGYFLVVADFISWARAQGIRVGPGRGSAAGSLVSYVLGITALDPIKYGLIFERFLNPSRKSLPDIDVDFDDRRRGEVIRYVTEKYGDDRVAQIITYGTIKAKQSLKDAARVLGMDYSVGEKLTKAMPPMILGKEMTLREMVEDPNLKPVVEVAVEEPTDEEFDEETVEFEPVAIAAATTSSDSKSRYKEAAEFRKLLEEDPDARKVFELARGLEGLKRQTSVHAAGVIMSAVPLMDVIPVIRRDDDGAIITAFAQKPCEDLGLVKMDFLGLRNLTVLDKAIENALSNRGETVVLEDLDLDGDQLTYEMLSRGETLGVFQLDGGQMRSLLKILKPSKFEHISAAIALYRPGPMGVGAHTSYAHRKNGNEQVATIHPHLEGPLSEILGPTFGLIVYQEQVMAVAQKVANFSLVQADALRSAMGKKLKDVLDEQKTSFAAGMKQNGFSDAVVETLWGTLLPFADYAFNKAHSAAYGVLSYWTAYMKANYPQEYMAALLTSVRSSRDRLGVYLSEARRSGIQVLPPDVNDSIADFRAVGKDIRFGLEAIRNVGLGVVQEIIRTRETEGKFESFQDFVSKVPASVCTKKVIESLIKAGAFDSFGVSRRALFEAHEEIIASEIKAKKSKSSGDSDLFGDFDSEQTSYKIANLAEWPQRQLLSLEREMLGLYVSAHPLQGAESKLRSSATETIDSFNSRTNFVDTEPVTLAGLITAVEVKTARKSGNIYANLTIEDLEGEVTLMIFNKTYQEHIDKLNVDTMVAIRGKMRPRDDGFSLNVYDIRVLEKEESNYVGPLKISIPEELATKKNVEILDGIFKRYPGQTEVQLLMKSESGITPYRLKHKVFVGDALISEVKQHFGTSALDDLVELSEVKNEEALEPVPGEDVTSLVVEQTGELFGQ